MASQADTSRNPTKVRKARLGLVSVMLGVGGVVLIIPAIILWKELGLNEQSMGLIPALFGLGAIVTGHWSRFMPGYLSGYVCLLIVALFPPPANPMHNTANAMLTLLSFNRAEAKYASKYGGGFSPTLRCLGPPQAGNPTATAAGLVESGVAGNGNVSEWRGYRFVYSPGPRDSQGRINSYSITASPLQPGVTASMFFYTDQTTVLRENATGPAGPKDHPVFTEGSAISSLQTLNTAEAAYASTYGGGFSPTLSCLGPPQAGNPTATRAGLIDSILAGTCNTSEKRDYRFVYSPGPRDKKGRISFYSITASPIQPGEIADRYFYTDQTGVVRRNSPGPAGPKDEPVGR